MHSRKVVLVSTSTYTPETGEALLRQLVEDKIELFCVVGVDAAHWEEALDWLCIGPEGESLHFIVTTSHPGESVDEVLSFAESWRCENAPEVEVVYA